MATPELLGSEQSGVPTSPQPPAERDFKRIFGYSYPSEMEPYLSKTINVYDVDAKGNPGSGDNAVYTGYKFSGLLQRFLLDYAVKVNSGVPLSDEVSQSVNRPI